MSEAAQGFTVDVKADRERGQVVRVVGDVDLQNSPGLRAKLIEVSEAKPPKVVVDLSGVGYIDSSGIGTLVDLKRRLERSGGRLTLTGLQPRVRGVLEITKLDQFFEIADKPEAERA